MAKRKNNQHRTIWLTFLGLVGLGLLVAGLLNASHVVLFDPRGFIADEQHKLMVTALAILVGFCVPVLTVLYFVAWKYRETNEKAHYNPHGGRSKLTVLAVWAIPLAVMVVLVSLLIPATFRLQPKDAIAADKPPMTIQVVALRWKWLFIYPEQNIATVNYLQIPVDTPVQFELTADEAPMNSFWIPQLGGQLYAMTQHVNRLNLMGTEIGEYQGSAAEINGAGFAGMRFKTHVTSQGDFDSWVGQIKRSANSLTTSEYSSLLQPSENNAPAFYASSDAAIYTNILSKYAEPGQHNMMDMEHEGHY